MDRWQRRRKSGCTCIQSVFALFAIWSLLIKMLSGTFSGTDKDEFRTTAGPYATSAALHQTHMHTELEKKRHREPSVTSGVRVLARDMSASGRPARRFDVLHLPHSATQRSKFCSFSFSMCLSLMLGGEIQNPRYLFCVFQTETTNSAAAAHNW